MSQIKRLVITFSSTTTGWSNTVASGIGHVFTGFDEVRGHARPHGAKPKNRNFAHMTPKLARDSYCLLVRLRGVSGFTI